jgi:hypothetical protein
MLSYAVTSILLVRSSDGVAKLQVYAAIGCIVGIFLFVRGFIMLRYKRLIVNTPFSKIRSACMGLVEVSGIAKGSQTIPAGLTGQACYYYEAIAWQLRQSGKSRQWQKVADERLYVPFFVEDPTGSLVVDPQGAQLDIHRNFKDELGSCFFGSRDMIPENISSFLLRNGVNGSEATKFEEYCIKPDDPMFVLGTLGQTFGTQQWTPGLQVTAAGSSHGFRLNFLGPTGTQALQALGWIPEPRTEAVILAMRAAGISSASVNRAVAPVPAAWSSVSMDEGNVASPSVGVATAEQPDAVSEPSPSTPSIDGTGSNLHPAAAIGKGTSNDPFMISWRSQKEVVQALAWKSALCIWGGPALTLACLYILLLTLGWT